MEITYKIYNNQSRYESAPLFIHRSLSPNILEKIQKDWEYMFRYIGVDIVNIVKETKKELIEDLIKSNESRMKMEDNDTYTMNSVLGELRLLLQELEK
jgi:hypothetical protein